jgi:amidohydrolase
MADANELKERAASAIESRRDELAELSLKIHANPEIAFEEVESSALIADYLEANGFSVDRGVCDLPTAFSATYGSGTPAVAIVCEYDALPGIGHGCGHNVIATASSAAGIAVRGLMDELGGTLRVVGTPAEEAAGGKVYMVDRGAFDGLDCAMMVHPGNRNTAIAYALSCLELDIEFKGKAAHAAARPDAGINALDAMIASFSSIGLLRQQLRDSARVHGIITEGGQAVNVIPHQTAAKLLIRTDDDQYMDDVLKPKVLACFQGAAEATGCELNYRWGEDSRYRTMRTNRALAGAYRANVESLGRIVVDPETQRSMGSTDMGNVSHMTPSIHPAIAIAPSDVPIHTDAFREFAASDADHAGLIDSAKALAMTAIDVFLDAGLRSAMKREFGEDDD